MKEKLSLHDQLVSTGQDVRQGFFQGLAMYVSNMCPTLANEFSSIDSVRREIVGAWRLVVELEEAPKNIGHMTTNVGAGPGFFQRVYSKYEEEQGGNVKPNVDSRVAAWLGEP